VLAVKSFPSSTNAFAGSQAAQHNVSDFACACALSMGAAAASPAATSPVNIKALLILASFVELCRLLAVAARERAHRPIDHGSSVRQLAFPGHGSPILGACDNPTLFIEALIYKQRKQKICATSKSFGLLVKLIRNRPLSALGDICPRGLPPTTVSPGG